MGAIKMMKRFTYKAFKKDIIDSINDKSRDTFDSFTDLENTIEILSNYGYLTNLQAQELNFIIFQKKRTLIDWEELRKDFDEFKELNRLQ